MFLPECAKATTFRKWITKALICRVACQHLFYPCAVLLANDLFRWKTFLLMKGTMGLLYVYTIRLFAKEPVAWFSIETTIYKGESRISKIFNSKPIKHLEGCFLTRVVNGFVLMSSDHEFWDIKEGKKICRKGNFDKVRWLDNIWSNEVVIP